MSTYGRHSHRYRTAHHRKLPPWAILLICVGAALAVSLLVGNLLKLFLDEETYDRLVNPPPAEEEPVDPVVTALPDLNAYPFVLGERTSGARAHVSVTLNTPAGALLYRSPVSAQLGVTGNDEVALTDSMSALQKKVDYVSGVFHPQALRLEGADLQYAETARERALMREFLTCGGNEILLVDVELSAETLGSVVPYLTALREELDAPVGIAVPLSVIQSADGWKILANLSAYSDFLAVDLTHTDAPDATELLTSLTYYRRQYDARLLIDERQTALIEALSPVGVSDFQILSELP